MSAPRGSATGICQPGIRSLPRAPHTRVLPPRGAHRTSESDQLPWESRSTTGPQQCCGNKSGPVAFWPKSIQSFPDMRELQRVPLDKAGSCHHSTALVHIVPRGRDASAPRWPHAQNAFRQRRIVQLTHAVKYSWPNPRHLPALPRIVVSGLFRGNGARTDGKRFPGKSVGRF